MIKLSQSSDGGFPHIYSLEIRVEAYPAAKQLMLILHTPTRKFALTIGRSAGEKLKRLANKWRRKTELDARIRSGLAQLKDRI